ncbi:MAG: membrane dipeptidase [Albidovulum sp.]|nr:membrane dipeptidase [Albidovulum sp.]MDE0531457.1 membrane dipeptidase [Albidovulum sp.]
MAAKNSEQSYLIDCLQYARWSEKIFSEMREGGVDAVHVTIAYHEDFRETVRNICDWHRRFRVHGDMIVHAKSANDIVCARETGRTAIFFGFQNPSPVGDDVELLGFFYGAGVRFMQLTYNNQSLLASGYLENADSGITRMGREVIAEMNRLGMVVDMSHSAELSILQAIELSARPIAVTHANPASWKPTPRNKSDRVLEALSKSGGMLGFSIYPNHLRNGSECTLDEFCQMIARTAEKFGVDMLGLGTDLCQDQPGSVVEWMRRGRWMRDESAGGAAAENAEFPRQPEWFSCNRDFRNVASGLRAAGFSIQEVDAIMGGNWMRFFKSSFGG